MNNIENEQSNAPSIPEQTPNQYDQLPTDEQLLDAEPLPRSKEEVQPMGGLAVASANVEVFAIPHPERFEEFSSHNQK